MLSIKDTKPASNELGGCEAQNDYQEANVILASTSLHSLPVLD